MDYVSKIADLHIFFIIGIILFFLLAELAAGLLRKSKRTKQDWIQEIVAFLCLSFIQPTILFTCAFVGAWLFPEALGMLSGVNIVLLIVANYFIEEFVLYWYHRKAHESKFLWKLHRTHHQAEEMGFFVIYRNSFFYYWMMPPLWYIGIIVFLGAGEAVAISLIIRNIILLGNHSLLKWDKPFYDNPRLTPIIKVLERIVVTPAFHHAHHGKSIEDSISNPNGNFGGAMTVWDQVFGTAQFPHGYPASYGLQHPTNDGWAAPYFYPVFKSTDVESELCPTYVKAETKTNDSVTVELVKGKTYLWCQCGMSRTQPFCDGSHNGTMIKPIRFEGLADGEVKLCNCKISKKPPYCDDSHLDLE
ncbi:MAG: sterol desaturase family protein [Crocinitomicaceae bacterium]|nr:sterol desaturase family protein [Crocinitomicaceae bacterium]